MYRVETSNGDNHSTHPTLKDAIDQADMVHGQVVIDSAKVYDANGFVQFRDVSVRITFDIVRVARSEYFRDDFSVDGDTLMHANGWSVEISSN